MEKHDLVKETTIYKDNKGAGRLYIPKEISSTLGWINKQQIFLKYEGNRLTIVPEIQIEE